MQDRSTFDDLSEHLGYANAPYESFDWDRTKRIMIDVPTVETITIDFDEEGRITRIEGY